MGKWPGAVLGGKTTKGSSGGEYSVAAADVDEFVVSGLAGRPIGGVSRAPEIVIAGCPDHFRKAPGQLLKRAVEVRRLFADVARNDEPVVGVVAYGRDGVAVDGMADVKVADGEQAHRIVNGSTMRAASPARQNQAVSIQRAAARPLTAGSDRRAETMRTPSQDRSHRANL